MGGVPPQCLSSWRASPTRPSPKARRLGAFQTSHSPASTSMEVCAQGKVQAWPLVAAGLQFSPQKLFFVALLLPLTRVCMQGDTARTRHRVSPSSTSFTMRRCVARALQQSGLCDQSGHPSHKARTLRARLCLTRTPGLTLDSGCEHCCRAARRARSCRRIRSTSWTTARP